MMVHTLWQYITYSKVYLFTASHLIYLVWPEAQCLSMLTNSFSFENVYFLIHFCLSSTLLENADENGAVQKWFQSWNFWKCTVLKMFQF